MSGVSFCLQESVTNDTGRQQPDLIVRLPGQKTIVIDAKAPLTAYLDSLQATDESVRKTKLQDHARQIRSHITALSRKAYWEQFKTSPEFVVLFLPGEVFFSAALEQNPALIEAGINQNVILATPTTLIGLLRAIAYGWRQEKIEQSANQIGQLGRELYKRISTMGEHWMKLGKHLEITIDSYNKAIGSLESQVLPSARKFKTFETTGISDDIAELTEIEIIPRGLHAPEMVSSSIVDEVEV